MVPKIASEITTGIFKEPQMPPAHTTVTSTAFRFALSIMRVPL